jgi:uncharacterized protein (TIGR02996 family)
MTPHQPFLDAIQADPDSDAPRLAYADWLAERGDAWSEVIRSISVYVPAKGIDNGSCVTVQPSFCSA